MSLSPGQRGEGGLGISNGEAGRNMAAKAWSSQQKAVDEIFFQNDAVSLCLRKVVQ